MTRLDPAALPAAGLSRRIDTIHDDWRRPYSTSPHKKRPASIEIRAYSADPVSSLPQISKANPRRPDFAADPQFVADIAGARPRSRPGYATGHKTLVTGVAQRHQSERVVDPNKPVYPLPAPAGGPIESDSWFNKHMSPSKNYAAVNRKLRQEGFNRSKHCHLDISDIPGAAPKHRYMRPVHRSPLDISDIAGARVRPFHQPHRTADPRPAVEVGRLGVWHFGDSGRFTKEGSERTKPVNPLTPDYKYDTTTKELWAEKGRAKESRAAGVRTDPHTTGALEGEIEGRMGDLQSRPGLKPPTRNHYHRAAGLDKYDRVLPPGPAAGYLPIPLGPGTI